MPEPTQIRLTPDASLVWDALIAANLMTQELEQALRRLSMAQGAVDDIIKDLRERWTKEI